MEKQLETIPDYLIKEIIDGKKYYYKDYQKVLTKETILEAIIGCSETQARIINAILQFLLTLLQRV